MESVHIEVEIGDKETLTNGGISVLIGVYVESKTNILRGLNKDFYHKTVTTYEIENYISEKMKNIFKMFDQDDDELINMEEMKGIFNQMG